MKVELKAGHLLDDAACRAATGNSLTEGYKRLDAHDGPALVRRKVCFAATPPLRRANTQAS